MLSHESLRLVVNEARTVPSGSFSNSRGLMPAVVGEGRQTGISALADQAFLCRQYAELHLVCLLHCVDNIMVVSIFKVHNIQNARVRH